MQLQRKEFVDVIQESFQDITGDFLNKRVSAILVDVFAEAVTRVLAEGNSVNLRGFGTFEVRERSGRNYINPNTGEMVAKPSAIYPAFIAGSELKRAVKERLNNETKKIFKKMIKEHDLGNEVTYVSTYENVRAVAKMLCSQPDTYIESITIEPPEWAGYDKAYLLTLSSDNLIWVEKAYFDNGHIARSGGVCYIDVTAIGDAKPEDFVLEGESIVKPIGGACDD